MRMPAYYPLFADLQRRQCLVIGGGLVAQRKVVALLQAKARVTVVSPMATQRLLGYARRGRIRHVARTFRPADLQGAWLVCAATDDHVVNEAVFKAATRRRIFTNVVDQPRLCSFIAPAIARRGSLTIAVSTGGASPTMARRLRDEMDRRLGPEYARLLRLLGGLRDVAKRRLPRYEDRKRYFDDLAQGRVFRLVQSGQTVAARRQALALLGRYAVRRGD
jgi:siroheme synthase-like protein